MKKAGKIILSVAGVLVAGAIGVGAMGWHYVMSPLSKAAEGSTIQVYPGERPDVVTEKVAAAAACDVCGFRWLTQRAAVQTHHAVNDSTFYPFKPGNYSVRQGDSMRTLWLRLASGAQTPVRLVVGSPRTMDRLAGSLANQLMADSASFAAAFHRPSLIDSLGYTIETLPALIVPNTYEVYWTMSPDDFMTRMKKEHDRFWTAERKAKAEAAGLTDTEVATLASIVCEETNKVDEMPVVAGLYLNRLHRGIPLQADPTVKFAVGDPTLRRILFVHLATPSPYNTYLNTGLPPGPIRIVEPKVLEAVLNAAKHDYLYMCAKEDFSGYHNFAVTLAEHNANARRYQAALNARGIK